MFKNKNFIWSIGGIVVIAATILFAGISSRKASATAETDVAVVTTVNITESVEASGQLEARASTNLMWKTSGTVEKVNVKVGDHVQAGDILLILETTSAPASIISAQADLVNAKLALDDVLKSTLALAKAQQALANAMQAVDDAQKDVTKLDYRRASDDLIAQTEDEIALAEQQVSRAEDNYKRFKNRPDGDTLKAQAELALINARTERNDKISMLNWYLGTPDNIDAAKYRAALAVAQAQQADAEREIARLKDGPNADDVAVAQARVDAAQATVNSLYIIAPFDGEVLSIEQNSGDVVALNQLSVRLADRSKLHVDAQVDEADIAQVRVGNLVSITMDAVPGVTLNGKVTFVNPVGETVAGLVKYTVRVELEPISEPLLLGATADVTIRVAEAEAALAVPAAAVQSDSAGEYVLLIETDGSTRRVDVQSSASVGELVIVTGNLNAGDQVQSTYTRGVQAPNPLGQ